MNLRALLTISLFAGCAAEQPATLPDPLQAGWRGESVCELLHEDANQRVLRCTFPPGVGHERHFHAPHFGYVIEGGRMQIDDANGRRTVDVPNGYSWVRDELTVHEALNVGESVAVYLIVEPKG